MNHAAQHDYTASTSNYNGKLTLCFLLKGVRQNAALLGGGGGDGGGATLRPHTPPVPMMSTICTTTGGALGRAASVLQAKRAVRHRME